MKSKLFKKSHGSSNIYQYLNLTTIIQCNLCYLTTVKLINTKFWYTMTFLKKWKTHSELGLLSYLSSIELLSVIQNDYTGITVTQDIYTIGKLKK